MSVEITITQITLIAQRAAMHIGVPADMASQVEQDLLADGTAEGVSIEDGGWGGDEDVVHVVIEIYAFALPTLVTSTMFQELASETLVENEDGNVLQITDGENWDDKVLELTATEIVS